MLQVVPPRNARQNYRWASVVVALTVGLLAQKGLAAVVHDGSLGTAGTVPGTTNFTILQARGKTVGSNLFHSFSAFDLTSSQSAAFLGDTSIRNVVARVTSGAASNVDGRIISTAGQGGGANLF